MIIESTDGKYYHLPRFEGDDYFVCVEENQFVLWLMEGEEPCFAGPHRAERLLRKLKLKADLAEGEPGYTIFFDLDCKSTLKKGVRYVLALRAPIPFPDDWSLVYDTAAGDALLCWSMAFSVARILDTFLQVNPDKLLLRFLGDNHRAKLRRQIPILKGARITMLNYQYYCKKLLQQYGHHVTLKRKTAYEAAYRV